MRHAHSTSVSKGGVWTVNAGGARAVEGVLNVEQVEAWHSEVWTSAVMLSHCINIRDVRSSIEMVSTSKLGRAMMQRRRVVWAWKSNWYLCIVGVTAFVPARFQASIKLAAYSRKSPLCTEKKCPQHKEFVSLGHKPGSDLLLKHFPSQQDKKFLPLFYFMGNKQDK